MNHKFFLMPQIFFQYSNSQIDDERKLDKNKQFNEIQNENFELQQNIKIIPNQKVRLKFSIKSYGKQISLIQQSQQFKNGIKIIKKLKIQCGQNLSASQPAIASISGLAYIRYHQMDNFNKKVKQMTMNGELKKYLYNAAEQSSYFIDDIMNNFQQQYNISHINSYKNTLLKFVEGKTLQTCAGSNRNLKYYTPGTNLTLIDWSPKMAAVGIGKTLPTVKYNYIIGDVTKMPFNDNQFDTVVDIFGLEHVLQPQKALQQIRRVCKKDGNILLMNQGLSGIVEFHYWQNAIAGQKLYNMGVFTNRNWQKILKQFDFQIKYSQRKKNGKLYIYVLKNKKDKNLQELNNLAKNQQTK